MHPFISLFAVSSILNMQEVPPLGQVGQDLPTVQALQAKRWESLQKAPLAHMAKSHDIASLFKHYIDAHLLLQERGLSFGGLLHEEEVGLRLRRYRRWIAILLARDLTWRLHHHVYSSMRCSLDVFSSNGSVREYELFVTDTYGVATQIQSFRFVDQDVAKDRLVATAKELRDIKVGVARREAPALLKAWKEHNYTPCDASRKLWFYRTCELIPSKVLGLTPFHLAHFQTGR